MSAVLHLMKIVPALPDLGAGGSQRPARGRAHRDPLEGLVEVIEVEQAHPLIGPGGAAVDPPHGQVHVDRVEIPLQGQGIAKLQLAISGQFATDQTTVLVLLEGLELVRRDGELVHDGENGLGINGELGKRHHFIVVFPAEPTERGRRHHAVHLGDLAHEGDRDHPREPIGVHRDDPIVDPGLLGHLLGDGEERQQDHHQEQADRRRGDREDRPDGITTGVAEDVSEVLHGSLETRVCGTTAFSRSLDHFPQTVDHGGIGRQERGDDAAAKPTKSETTRPRRAILQGT